MARPKAYCPEQGYYAQLLLMGKREREWEHLDYATDRTDKEYLIGEYELAYRGQGIRIKAITLPEKYWDKERVHADSNKRSEARRSRWKEKQMQVTSDGQLSGLN